MFMNKKSIEIIMAIASVVIFTVLLIMVNLSDMATKSYGFIAVLALFVIFVSLFGIKLAMMD